VHQHRQPEPAFDGFTQDELRGVERDNALKLFPRFA